jgi:drug/metabolite transporter (DMT)-like permease
MSPAAPAPRAASADWLLLLVPSFIWGTTWYAIKFQLGPVAPEVSVAYRFLLAALLLLGFCLVRGVSLRFGARQHLAFAVEGALQFGVNYLLVYLAEGQLTSGLVALLFGLLMPFNLIGARIFYGTRLTASVLAGASLGLAGVALVVWPDLFPSAQAAGGGASAAGLSGGVGAQGLWLAVGGSLAASAGNLWSQRLYRQGVPVVQSTAWGMLYGSLLVVAYAALIGRAFTWDRSTGYLVSLGYLAVFGSVVAFVTYLTLVKRLGAGPAGYSSVIIPVIAMATSTVFEGYRWTALALLGMAMVVVGNVLVMRRKA